MTFSLQVVVLLCLSLAAYSYLIYPLVLVVLASLVQAVRDVARVVTRAERRAVTADELLPVAIVIAAYNEEVHIRQRVENLLALDYPTELVSIYIGSDGSRDETASILASFQDPRLNVFAFSENRGKARVLNDLVSRTSAPVLVFSDANTFFDQRALKQLVRHFGDERVGGVSGELRLTGVGGDNQDSLYWRVEQLLKFFEARIHGLLGANGAIYAIRRSLWLPLRGDTICDDFCVAMSVAASGHRLVYDPSAWADEETPASIPEEFQRRVRIGIGNFQALCRHPEYLFKTSAGTAFAYVSHKVLRWLAPHLLVVALTASAVLALNSHFWLGMTLAQAAAYGGAALLYRLSIRGVRLPGLLRIVAFLFALNWAFLVASWRYASGRYSGSWRRTSR